MNIIDLSTLTPAAPQPTVEIVITNVTTDNPGAIIQPGDVTVPVGTTVTVTAELRGPDGAVLPVDAMFRMPFVARDGRERILLAQFVQGVASIGTTMAESGCWQITEATINRDLPPEQHMRFAGLSIYAVQ